MSLPEQQLLFRAACYGLALSVCATACTARCRRPSGQHDRISPQQGKAGRPGNDCICAWRMPSPCPAQAGAALLLRGHPAKLMRQGPLLRIVLVRTCSAAAICVLSLCPGPPARPWFCSGPVRVLFGSCSCPNEKAPCRSMRAVTVQGICVLHHSPGKRTGPGWQNRPVRGSHPALGLHRCFPGKVLMLFAGVPRHCGSGSVLWDTQ